MPLWLVIEVSVLSRNSSRAVLLFVYVLLGIFVDFRPLLKNKDTYPPKRSHSLLIFFRRIGVAGVNHSSAILDDTNFFVGGF